MATTNVLVQFTPLANEPPASAFATLDTRNAHVVLDFDGSTDEEAVFSGVLPTHYSGGGLTIETLSSTSSVTIPFRPSIFTRERNYQVKLTPA